METSIEYNDNADGYSPLVLAYIGDAVYELYIRSRLVAEGNMPVNKLHCAATGFVKAKAQFDAFHAIEEKLNEQELHQFKRGRNAKSQTMPKNAEMLHYRVATGLEALIGYLHISGQYKRCDYIMNLIYEGLKLKEG